MSVWSFLKRIGRSSPQTRPNQCIYKYSPRIKFRNHQFCWPISKNTNKPIVVSTSDDEDDDSISTTNSLSFSCDHIHPDEQDMEIIADIASPISAISQAKHISQNHCVQESKKLKLQIEPLLDPISIDVNNQHDHEIVDKSSPKPSSPSSQTHISTTPPPSMFNESKRNHVEPTVISNNVVADHDKQWIIFDASKSIDMNVYSYSFDGLSNMVISPFIHHQYLEKISKSSIAHNKSLFEVSASSDHVENVLNSNHSSSICANEDNDQQPIIIESEDEEEKYDELPVNTKGNDDNLSIHTDSTFIATTASIQSWASNDIPSAYSQHTSSEISLQPSDNEKIQDNIRVSDCNVSQKLESINNSDPSSS